MVEYFPMSKTTLSDNIKTRMTELGVKSMRSLSLDSGVSEGTVKMIVNGSSKNPRSDVLNKIASILQCTSDELKSGTWNSDTNNKNTFPEVDPELLSKCLNKVMEVMSKKNISYDGKIVSAMATKVYIQAVKYTENNKERETSIDVATNIMIENLLNEEKTG